MLSQPLTPAEHQRLSAVSLVGSYARDKAYFEWLVRDVARTGWSRVLGHLSIDPDTPGIALRADEIVDMLDERLLYNDRWADLISARAHIPYEEHALLRHIFSRFLVPKELEQGGI